MTSSVETGRGLLAHTGALMRDEGLSGRAFVITDRNVYPHCAETLTDSLASAGFEPCVNVLEPGEQTKTVRSFELLCDWLAESRAERSDVVVALGGGVVGDLAGFVAASYLRGMPLVQVPTTLLAMVDSSIGGKTGVNLPRAKNLIGAFYPAALVAIDPALVDSLPAREYRGGLGEVIKYGMIMDAALYELVDSRQDDILARAPELVDRVVARCAELKQEVVGEDEREAGRRVILNFGHTIGHAIEAATNYEALLHGEAVAIGMSGAAQIAVELGMLDPALCDGLQRLLKGLGLPFAARGLAWETVREAMAHDKKTRAGKIRWVLPRTIGSVEVTDAVPPELVDSVLQRLMNA